MFEDKDFTVDEEADEYKMLHPNAAKEKDAEQRLIQEHFEEVRACGGQHGWVGGQCLG